MMFRAGGNSKASFLIYRPSQVSLTGRGTSAGRSFPIQIAANNDRLRR